MSRLVRIALLQQLHGIDPGLLIGQAAARNAEIVVFPEMYSNGYASFADALSEREWRAGAVDANGPFVDQFRQAARVHDVHVVATLLEAAKPDPFNAALLIDRKGDTVLSHRKVHTCFFDVPERACGRGDTFSVAKIATSEGDVCVGTHDLHGSRISRRGTSNVAGGRGDNSGPELLQPFRGRGGRRRPNCSNARSSV